MKNLSLRKKAAILISLMCLIIFAVIYFYEAKEISSGFKNLEIEDAKTNLFRAKDAIQYQETYLKSKLGDWSQWDDAYKFMHDQNKAFKDANLQPSLANLKVNIFSFWSADSKLVWGTKIDFLQEDDQKKLFSIPSVDIDTLSKFQKLHQQTNINNKVFTYVKLSDGAYLLESSPITSSDGKSPLVGNLVAGIKLDKAFFEALSKRLHLDIGTYDLVNETLASEGAEVVKNINEFNWAIKVKDEKTIDAYASIENDNKEDIITYKLVIPRSIYLQSQKTLKTFLIGKLIAGTLFIILLMFALNNFILSRLLQLSNVIRVIKATGDLSQKVPKLGHDEIGQLGSSFNEMLLEIENLRATSFNKEKLASLGEMAGGIAHEINNPITIIGGSSNLMRKMIEKGIDDKGKMLKQLDDIDKTVIRITKIIGGLRNVTRDTEHEKFALTTLEDILNDSISICSEKFKNNGVNLICHFDDPVMTIKINSLRVQMSQVFFNLLSNAFDAVEKLPSPWIEITAKKSNDKIIIFVRDSGMGVPQEIQNKIFQPFFTTKEVGRGTGLGLSLCSKIIKLHNGDLYINSDDKNTCFVIELPIGD